MKDLIIKRKAYFSVFKVLQFFLLTLLLLSFLLTSGCTPISNLLFGPSGSIEVTTYPSGAKIFLNDKDTGHVTPYTIINLTKGTYEVKVTLGDISYSETVIVYSNHTTSVYKDLLPRLNKIIVQPSYMNLEEGESQTIDSITAYYFDSGSVDIKLSDCSYSSSNNHATVNSNGTVTGVSEGSAIITVSYTNVKITKTDTVNVTISSVVPPPVVPPIVYRAFCVGVGDYINFPDSYGNIDLLGPTYDVNRIGQTLSQCMFGPSNTSFSVIWYTTDWSATKSSILQGIASIFSEADYNDISYFYFSGHGIRVNNTSYLCPTEVSYYSPITTYISVDELESALSAIPGTKVVFLDTCHSGGFIGKGKEKINISQEELGSFNDEIINVFSQAQSKGLLTTNQYKVLTACHYYQESMGIYPIVPGAFDPYGVFTIALCEGCGYSGSYPADTNLDTKVSLQEAYLYVKSYVEELDALLPDIDITQNVQVFPKNSNFTIVEH